MLHPFDHRRPFPSIPNPAVFLHLDLPHPCSSTHLLTAFRPLRFLCHYFVNIFFCVKFHMEKYNVHYDGQVIQPGTHPLVLLMYTYRLILIDTRPNT